MKVTVKEGTQEHFCGFFDHLRRRPGDVFAIPDEPRRLLFPAEQKAVEFNDQAKESYAAIKDKDGKIPQAFSFRWMEPVGDAAPEVTSTAQQALDRKSNRIKEEKTAARGETADVI